MKKSNIMSASALFLGILLAVATSAFTPIHKNAKGFTMYTFFYSGPDYSVSNVEDQANWTYTSNNTLCDDVNDKACRLQATDSYVDLSGATPVLDATIAINASTGGTGKAFVSSIADSQGAISNSTD